MPDFYCCFVDPAPSDEERDPSEPCPECGRPYDFPLKEVPLQILDYRIVKPLQRGFYSATYVGKTGQLERPAVLKVIPVAMYDSFNKDFAAECRRHDEVASGSDHVVDILDFNQTPVRFGDLEIMCHVAVLQYVDGPTLAEFAETASASSLAQIAIDLFRLLQELERKELYHNDLHDENIIIQQLPQGSGRADALDESIRAVAIDLGSIADRSKSGGKRLSDLHSIAEHLFSFVDRLLSQPDAASEIEYRLASALEEIGFALRPETVMQRTPDFGDIVDQIRRAANFSSSPWRSPGELQRFGDSYNAQALHPSFVPRLLVDPNDEWVPAISSAGPQLITGMRGCGKTMLLRALQFHARASDAGGPGEDAETVIRRLRTDHFVGLYVSATRLLDKLGRLTPLPHEPYARLYVAYAREAVRAARHLREIDRSLVIPGYHQILGEAVAQFIRNAGTIADAPTEIELEHRLQQVLASLSKGETEYALEAHPTVAFPYLAEAVRRCSPLWQDATVLFLFDDATTRNLDKQAVSELLSTLLFQSESCSFKVTTETQTYYELLRSPGLIEKARQGRDYQNFDLGNEVDRYLSARDGKRFIANILGQRARAHTQHPSSDPESLLGNVSLEQIARDIRNLSDAPPSRKSVYHGIRALTAICVGDIGDVISIYDQMLRAARQGGAARIDPAIQTSAYQEYCNRRIYHLNRRDGRLKDFALSFAQASHDLLQRSDPKRLRQYTKIYVRLTTGDTAAQFEQIRELIDSGVFVFQSGADTPRKKTHDSDPMQQFVLTYRKLFGLSSYIGLADRDRFELSGADLEDWLQHPENGREILLRNLTGKVAGDSESPPTESETGDPNGFPEPEVAPAPFETAPKLFDLDATTAPPATVASEAATREDETADATGRILRPPRVPDARRISLDDPSLVDVESFITGLGFEDRTLKSAERLLASVKPRRALLVRYQEPGYASEIERVVRDSVPEVEIVDYSAIVKDGIDVPIGGSLVDVTGLAKPVLFGAVLGVLQSDHHVWIGHTQAEDYYPLSDDIAKVFAAEQNRDDYALLDALDQVWSGEEGPYQFDRLLDTEADDSRRRLLLASASPKHQRLLSLLEERDYDRIDILAPREITARNQLAVLAADVASRGIEESETSEVDSDDLQGALQLIGDHYQRWYVDGGYDFEVGLTGSKLHAVAFAAACATLRISQAWYVRPRRFDQERFTQGVGDTHIFQIEMP